jgi:polyferredoxin
MQTTETMVHAGLPLAWVAVVALIAIPLFTRALIRAPEVKSGNRVRQLPLLNRFLANPWPQFFFRVLFAGLFLLVIYAGVVGSPIPERNFATVVTWNFWWAGLIFVVLFAGTAWCGVCPWDSIAQWLTRRRLWKRGDGSGSLGLPVPAWLRSVWPAAGMFVLLTWLELGFGITRSPYGTAMLALLMVTLATLSMALFERKAFCRYFCAVGRTLGTYAQMSPVELRPRQQSTCDACKTLDCYHGNREIEPCPTRLVMGRMKQNTYCTSCGACVRSCPQDNVSWQLRGLATEIKLQARPHFDEAWFILILLALTSFHGITMMPAWEQAMSSLGRQLGDSGSLLFSFSLLMAAFMAAIFLSFGIAARTTRWLSGAVPQDKLYLRLAFTAVPLAFAYHLAHNAGHLFRESGNNGAVWLNPTGKGALPLSAYDIQCRIDNAMMFNNGIHALQALLVVGGLYLAIEVLRHRMRDLYTQNHAVAGYRLLPMLLFVILVSGFNLWLLTQPMVMRY